MYRERETERQWMIDDIEMEIRHTQDSIGRDHFDPKVMETMRKVPREDFVPAEYRQAAFNNGPLPIGYGQTISQPYIVALMTDLLAIQAEHKVLEIGTGSGYQTAILASLCQHVYTIEVVHELSGMARQRFKVLGYDNITAKAGNGYGGWPEFAPYDGIIVTAAAGSIPTQLIEQLKPGGKMVIPVGSPHSIQELMVFDKAQNGETRAHLILDVAFVPLIEPTQIEPQAKERN